MKHFVCAGHFKSLKIGHAAKPRIDVIEPNEARVAFDFHIAEGWTLVPMLQQLGYEEKDITITFSNNLQPKDIPQLIDKTNEHGR